MSEPVRADGPGSQGRRRASALSFSGSDTRDGGGSTPSHQTRRTGASVNVYVRLRPPEKKSDIDIYEHSVNRPGVITLKDPLSSGRSEHSYEFSAVFLPEHEQGAVSPAVAGPAVDAAVAGHSSCVIAYGQTGSGKTYSIFGERTGSQRGLLMRSIERLFSTTGMESGISVSFLQVYLDEVHDLGKADEDELDGLEKTEANSFPAVAGRKRGYRRLSTAGVGAGDRSASNSVSHGDRRAPTKSSKNTSLEVRETPAGQVFVKSLRRLPVTSIAEVRQIIDQGLGRRATAVTALNERSSRSHTVFTVYLPCKSPPARRSLLSFEITSPEEGPHHGPVLSFVDLAGSERLARSKAEGARFQEAVAINSSLTALGKVVLALTCDPSGTRHIPFRDSKLTRILSPCFGGDSQVSLLAQIHPRIEDYEESLNTLSFADRCKNVIRQPKVDYISSTKSSQLRIKDLQLQVERLRQMLQKAQAAAPPRRRSLQHQGDEVDQAIEKVVQEVLAVGSGTASQRLLPRAATVGNLPGPVDANLISTASAALVSMVPGQAAADTTAAAAAAASSSLQAGHAVAAAPVGVTSGEASIQLGSACLPGIGGYRSGSQDPDKEGVVDPKDASPPSKAEQQISLQVPAAGLKRKDDEAMSLDGGSVGSPTSPSRLPREQMRNQELAALVQLQEERKAQEERYQGYKKQLEALQSEYDDLTKQDEARDHDISRVAERCLALDAEIKQAQAELQERIIEQTQLRRTEIGNYATSTKERLHEATNGLLDIQGRLHLHHQVAKETNVQWEQQRQTLQGQHERILLRLKGEHDTKLDDLRTQYSASMAGRVEKFRKLSSAFDEYRERGKAELVKSQRELVDLYHRIAKLTSVIVDFEEGKFTQTQHGNLRRAILPAGLIPPMPSRETHSVLFEALDRPAATAKPGRKFLHWRSTGRGGSQQVTE